MSRNDILVFAILFLVGCGGQDKSATTKEESGTPSVQSMANKPNVNIDNFLQRATRHLQKGDYLAAIKTLDAAIRKDRQDVRSYLLLGETYMHIKRYDKAVDTLIAAYPLAPDNGQLNYLLAVNYHLNGANEEAIQYTENSIKIFGKNKDEENFKKSLALLQGLKSGSVQTKSN